MILNFYLYSLNSKVFTVHTLFVILFPLGRFGCTDFMDIFSRALLSDFFLNTYYYFWTVFWYIPTLLLSLVLLYTLLSNLHVNKLPTLMTLIVVLCVYELFDYWNLNITYTGLLLNPDNLNLLLMNSINKYHPSLLYCVLVSIPLSFCLQHLFIYLTHSVFFSKSQINLSNTVAFKYKPLTMVLALFLGSWWAVQEGSWGGWWNWDPSEVFGLVVMLLTLAGVHTKPSPLQTHSSYIKTFIVFLVVHVIYVFIQLNFNLVSHNFNIKITGFINTTQFFFAQLLTLIHVLARTVSCLRVDGSKLHTLTLKNLVLTRNQNLFYYLVLVLLVCLQVLVSFHPLVSSFYWGITRAGTLNWFISPVNLVSHLIIMLLVMLWYTSLHTLVVYTLHLKYSLSYWVVALTNSLLNNKLLTSKLHTVTVVFLLTSVCGYYTLETFWLVIGWSTGVGLLGNVCTLFYEHHSVSLGYMYAVTPNTFNSFFEIPFSAFYYNSTSLEGGNFSLLSVGAVTYQNLLNDLLFRKFNVSVLDSSILVLCDTSSVLFVMYWLLLTCKTVLIF